jgi:hypothetical protein
MGWATVQWEIEEKLEVVQGCIERAAQTMSIFHFTYQLDQSSARRTYRFLVNGKGVGGFSVSVLPRGHTQLRGYKAYDPSDDTWLVQDVRQRVPADQQSEPLRALLDALAWQIEQGIFNLAAQPLFELPPARDKRASGWSRFGLEDPDLLGQAFHEFNKWREKVPNWREQEFDALLEAIDAEIRGAGLSVLKPDDDIVGTAAADIGAQSHGSVSGASSSSTKTPGEQGKRVSERTMALNKLAVLWVTYNQTARISRADGMGWFIQEHATELGLSYVTVGEFKRHLPKAHRAQIIDKDEKTRKFVPRRKDET